jgi:rRNA-processing protein EBP2
MTDDYSSLRIFSCCTVDHMAKVKDRLIFETKKMDAVAQRKSNKEHKLRAKETHANKNAEKAKRKREHFASLDDWAKSAAAKRGRRAIDDGEDEDRLRSFGQGGGGRSPANNTKRLAADKKFGFGGKKGRFKQNDRKTLNDTSSFNPRGGSFSGGKKKVSAHKAGGSGGKGKTSSSNKRPGKRARDSKRSQH